MPIIDRFAHEIWATRNRVVHPHLQATHHSVELIEWIQALSNATTDLRNVSRIPDTTAQYALLEKARTGIHRAEQALHESSLPLITRARSITEQFQNLLNFEIERLMKDIRLKHSIEPAFLTVGDNEDIILRIKMTLRCHLENFRWVRDHR